VQRSAFRSRIIGAVLLGLIAVQCVADASGGGTQIVNAASVTYRDAAGHSYSTISNDVVTSITKLSSLLVSPKEAAANASNDGVAIGPPAARTFTITNTSNIPDAYQLDQLSAGSQKISSVQWVASGGNIPTGIGGTVSPTVAPGASIALVATIATSGMQIGTTVPVTVEAHTTVSGTGTGIARDSGEQWLVGKSGPKLTGTGGPDTQVAKTVNQVAIVQSQPGNLVLFQITALNSGGVAATNIVLSDPVPQGLTAVLSSAQINGAPAGPNASLNGGVITFHVASLLPGATLAVSFQAELPAGATLGESFLNVASISADGIPPEQTTPANVFTGSANIVFDGFAGGSHPIASATVSLLDTSGIPVKLTGQHASAAAARDHAAAASLPKPNTTNPYVTGADGTYGFALLPSSIPASGAKFFLTIAAPGYLNRHIEIDLQPTAQDFFYNVAETALDSQPLAAAGGFTLTQKSVNINDVFGLFGNLPLFAQRTIVVTKTVDKTAAPSGDVLLYSIAFTDQTPRAIGPTRIVDTFPAGLVYLPGSARLDDAHVEPKIDGRTLTWTLPGLQPGEGHTIVYGATIFGTVPAGTNLTNSVGVTGAIPGTSSTTGGSSAVTVSVLDGVLTPRRIVTGRVFIDIANTGHFTKGDRPVPGVRVTLEDGSYAITDANGEYSFPSVRPGMHVLRLDPLTLPGSVRLDSNAPMNSTHALQRLLHGILDDATMEDIQFALEPKP
jgi:uncharacterized repeat protein (TIGR01451 family)